MTVRSNMIRGETVCRDDTCIAQTGFIYSFAFIFFLQNHTDHRDLHYL